MVQRCHSDTRDVPCWGRNMTYQYISNKEISWRTSNNMQSLPDKFGKFWISNDPGFGRKVSLAPGLEKPTNHKATGIHQKKPVIFGGLYPLNNPSKCPYKASYIYIYNYNIILYIYIYPRFSTLAIFHLDFSHDLPSSDQGTQPKTWQAKLTTPCAIVTALPTTSLGRHRIPQGPIPFWSVYDGWWPWIQLEESRFDLFQHIHHCAFKNPSEACSHEICDMLQLPFEPPSTWKTGVI